MSSLNHDSYFCSYKRRYAEPGPRVALRGMASSSLFSSSPSGGSRPYRPLALAEVDLSQAAQASAELRAARTQEKAQLRELNDRFAGFIERVRELEQQNRALEAELLALRRRHAEPCRLRAIYEQEARQLRAAVEEARADKRAALGRRGRLEEALAGLRARCEEEALGREGAEGRLAEARREADEAALARAEAGERARALREELAFLGRLHDGETAELRERARLGAPAPAEAEAGRPDLAGALRDVRAQYERLAARNLQSAEDWFRSKVGGLEEGAARRTDAARSSRDQAGDVRRQLQSCALEVDAGHGVNRALEKQLREVEDKHSAEIAALQDTIGQLESELRAMKSEMARYLKEYQDLLNVKMALDIEIAAYRKLLEGEESRFSVGLAGGYSHSMSAAPSFSRSTFSSLGSGTPYLLSSRLLTASFSTHEVIAASQSLQAAASPAREEEKEEKEEETQEEETGGEEAAEAGEKEGQAEEEGDKEGEDREKEAEAEAEEEGGKEVGVADGGKEDGVEEEGAQDKGGEEKGEKKGEREGEKQKGDEKGRSEAVAKGGEAKRKDKEVEQPKGQRPEEKKKEDEKEKQKEKKKE